MGSTGHIKYRPPVPYLIKIRCVNFGMILADGWPYISFPLCFHFKLWAKSILKKLETEHFLNMIYYF